jgi:putative hydrolase of HD superfamily
MKPERALDFLREVNRLKLVPRTGWLLRGVWPGESVADHSYGMAVTALVLADLVEEPVDRERLLVMALIHDLAETITGDVPYPAGRFFPEQAKTVAEEQVLGKMLDGLPIRDDYITLWREYKSGSSVEGRLVKDADRLERLIQAAAYERAGAADLDEFWEELGPDDFTFSASWQLVETLRSERRS